MAPDLRETREQEAVCPMEQAHEGLGKRMQCDAEDKEQEAGYHRKIG